MCSDGLINAHAWLVDEDGTVIDEPFPEIDAVARKHGFNPAREFQHRIPAPPEVQERIHFELRRDYARCDREGLYYEIEPFKCFYNARHLQTHKYPKATVVIGSFGWSKNKLKAKNVGKKGNRYEIYWMWGNKTYKHYEEFQGYPPLTAQEKREKAESKKSYSTYILTH